MIKRKQMVYEKKSMKKLVVRDLIKKFNFEVLAGSEKSFENELTLYGINCAGLELAGFFPKLDSTNRRIILLSSKENSYVKMVEKKELEKRYHQLMQGKSPAILVTKKFDDELIIKVAQENQYPLIRTNELSTSQLTPLLSDFFDEYFAPTEEIHASLLNVYGKGILLKGVSGIGKSEITLELVRKNHLFVGDDRIVINRKNNHIFGKSHEVLKNLIEVRGLGIIDLSKLYGLQIILEETSIDLIIELINTDDEKYKTIDRLGKEYSYFKLLDIDVPIVKIPVTYGRNISELIEAAVAKLKLDESGVSSIDELQRRLLKTLQEK